MLFTGCQQEYVIVASRPNSVLGRHFVFRFLVQYAIRHTHEHTEAGLFWTSDQLVAEAVTYTTHNIRNSTSMPSAGLEPAILFTAAINAKRFNSPTLNFAFMLSHMYLFPCPQSNTEYTKSSYSFVLRQIYSLLHSQFSTQCDLVLFLSISSTLSFP